MHILQNRQNRWLPIYVGSDRTDWLRSSLGIQEARQNGSLVTDERNDKKVIVVGCGLPHYYPGNPHHLGIMAPAVASPMANLIHVNNAKWFTAEILATSGITKTACSAEIVSAKTALGYKV